MKTNLRKEIDEGVMNKLLLKDATYWQIIKYSLKRFVRGLKRLHKHRIVLEFELVLLAVCVGYMAGRV